MLRFIASRFLQAVPTLLVLVTVTFFMLRLVPGGPFSAEKAAPPEVQRNLEAFYGLDRPLLRQYADYLWRITPKRFRPGRLAAAGSFDLEAAFGVDFGPSFRYPDRTVGEVIARKLPVSVELGLWAMALALPLGLALGIAAALRPNGLLDLAASGISVAGLCLPTFVLGPLLVLGFAVHLGWFNASGWYEPSDRVLPAVTLAGVYAASIARLARTGLRDTLSRDFVRTARAKGASETRVVLRHALRSGVLPVVSWLGPAMASILTGSFVVETIFQIPGLGREFVAAARNLDYTLVTALVVLFGALVVAFNVAADVAAAWLDPRQRHA